MIVAAVAATALLVLLAAPRLLRLDEAPPVLAAAVFMSALLVRAAISVVAAAAMMIAVAATDLFEAVSRWCWHAVLPVLTQHFTFNGHAVADAAFFLPGFLLMASAFSVAFGIARAARGVRRLFASGVGSGPSNCLIIGGKTVFVAAAGLRRPRIVVSAGALTALDDDELYASLEHEKGHIARRHRWVLLLGELCRSIGRLVPGGRTTLAELSFHLERDADRFAIARYHEPHALASAICKAAESGSAATPTATSLAGAGAGAGVVRRVSQLLTGMPQRGTSTTARIGGVVSITLTVLVLAAVPPTTMAAVRSSAALPAFGCPH
ncbi:MAG: M56 family metallopeptidase [Solirubrobacteraceae bacterium]